ncbi:MAG: MarR family transcriptional regulator [Pseudomonadota bacterium]
MTANQANTARVRLPWSRYRDNLSRHVIGLSRHLQTSMMSTLQDTCGHAHLRLGFAPYITLLGSQGRRLSELADTLGVSRQACNQAVKQIEAAGYIERQPDPLDGRARHLMLSEAGEALRQDGVRVVRELDQQFASIAGDRAVVDASRTLGKIYKQLALGLSGRDEPQILYGGLGGLLPRLSDYSLQRLMALTQAKGHPSLKLSYGQVLTQIGPQGGRIQHMAAIHDVSKQAISAIASELETLGYVRRESDPADARQLVLRFTNRGEVLIADSVASVETLESEFADITGAVALRRAARTLSTLYHGLGLERELFDKEQQDLPTLARQLQHSLGAEASRALAQLLLAPEQN